MKYNLKIGDRTFEVVIEDINKRPVVARVNGQEFLVNLEPDEMISEPAATLLDPPATPGGLMLHDGSLVAPLPGTVIELFVKPGDMIEAGQVILINEAMKMKNSIRSTKDGIVARVLVSAGQSVAHKQTLVEFEE